MKMSNNEVIQTAIRLVLAEWHGHSSFAWAGECGTFADFAHGAAKQLGVNSDFDSFDNNMECDSPLPELVGLSKAEMTTMAIPENLNHAWLVLNGRHYDAASREGVETPWDLRCVRQTLVEVLTVAAPAKLQALQSEHAWWKESVQLMSEFEAMSAERDSSN